MNHRFKTAKLILLTVEIGLLIYWVAVAFSLLPPQFAFKDYTSPMIHAWNWSFFPLDLLASGCAIAGVLTFQRTAGLVVLLAGLTFTFCAGLMAIGFWALYGDFDPFWWGSNALLMVMPAVVLTLLWPDIEARTTAAIDRA